MSTVRSTSTSNNQRLRSAGNNDLRSNTFAPTQWVLLFLVTDGQNTCDQITRYRRSKPMSSNYRYLLCIPFILGESPNKCWLHKYHMHNNNLGPVARSLVSANRWLRGIKMYTCPWYLTLVSTNHASSNPGLEIRMAGSSCCPQQLAQ